MCSLCTKYKRILLLVPTSLERCFNLGPLPGCQLPWGCLWAAASEGGAFSDHSQLCNCKEALFQVPPPSRVDAISFYPSLLQTPQAHIKSLVLPLAAGFFQERGSTLQALDLFPPPPTSSTVSKVADREARKEAWGQMEGMGLGSGNEEQECGQQHYRHEAGAPWLGAKRPGNSRPEAKDPFLLCLGT